MYKFTIDGISKLGDFDEKYGQRYWATTTESDLALMFNSMSPDLADMIENGPFEIVAEEQTEKESGKGTPYLALKKVKVLQNPRETAQKPAQSPITEELVKETFKDEMGVEGLKTAQTGDKPAYHQVNDPAQASLDRIEAAIQELQSSVDKLIGGQDEY